MSNVQFESRPHLLLHFDLTDTADNARADAYRAIEGITTPVTPTRLTRSVFFVPIPDGVGTWVFLVEFWKALAAATSGLLRHGDVFFLHAPGSLLYHQVENATELDAHARRAIFRALDEGGREEGA